MISLDNIRHYVQDAFITGPLQQNLDGLQIIGPSGELQDSEPIFMLHVDIFDWLGEEEGSNTRTVHHAATFIQRCLIIPIPLVDVSLLPSYELLHRGVVKRMAGDCTSARTPLGC